MKEIGKMSMGLNAAATLLTEEVFNCQSETVTVMTQNQ